VAGVITASEPSWIGPFTGLSPRCFGKLVTALRREGVDAVRNQTEFLPSQQEGAAHSHDRPRDGAPGGAFCPMSTFRALHAMVFCFVRNRRAGGIGISDSGWR
jgi:hypothetical protein